jgi:S-adenosylmethionine:tRNA ribosyltransferase-isomerase
MAARGIDFSAVTLHVGLGTFRPIAGDDADQHEMHAEWFEVSDVAVQEINGSRDAGQRIVAVGTTVVRTLETIAAQSGSSAGAIDRYAGETTLFIRPGHSFRVVDALMTNFHFPRTTLLLLVQAFGGSELIREAYETAVKEEYRFYSYGDAMLIV